VLVVSLGFGKNILDNQVREYIIVSSLAGLARRGSGGQMWFISAVSWDFTSVH